MATCQTAVTTVLAFSLFLPATESCGSTNLFPWFSGTKTYTCEKISDSPLGSLPPEKGKFQIPPENRICEKNENITLKCSPRQLETVTWYIYSRHVHWTTNGLTDPTGSSLTLGCGIYAVACVYTDEISPKSSELVYISEDGFLLQPENAVCNINGRHTFSCVTGHNDDVLETKWIVNGSSNGTMEMETLHDGIQLQVRCLPEYNNIRFQCIVYLHGGNISSNEGILTVSSETTTESLVNDQQGKENTIHALTGVIIGGFLLVFFITILSHTSILYRKLCKRLNWNRPTTDTNHGS